MTFLTICPIKICQLAWNTDLRFIAFEWSSMHLMAWDFYLSFYVNHSPLQPTVQVIIFLFIRLLSEMWYVFSFRNDIFSASVSQLFSWMLSAVPVNKPYFPTIYSIKSWKNKGCKMASALAEEFISFPFTYGKQSIWILFANWPYSAGIKRIYFDGFWFLAGRNACGECSQ